MMTKNNPRVQRKEEGSPLMPEDWCWNLRKVSVVFTLRFACDSWEDRVFMIKFRVVIKIDSLIESLVRRR